MIVTQLTYDGLVHEGPPMSLRFCAFSARNYWPLEMLEHHSTVEVNIFVHS